MGLKVAFLGDRIQDPLPQIQHLGRVNISSGGSEKWRLQGEPPAAGGGRPTQTVPAPTRGCMHCAGSETPKNVSPGLSLQLPIRKCRVSSKESVGMKIKSLRWEMFCQLLFVGYKECIEYCPGVVFLRVQ